eukprot:CAMPEP_0195080406 /NCGR_PEP_ID=MMETSP0448-20130528/22115_1 /TAXON_ID=66468 /ORGANISM="Heterocapsa triquestra, Strain CCMP 448" /LENGTH=47 /DNA_ID= /DNA_START= /DNA_END= /DNA_ORIENTATION=
MIFNSLRRVPERQHTISKDLCDYATKVLNKLRHHRQVARENKKQVCL